MLAGPWIRLGIDKETGRQGDKETEKQGNRNTRSRGRSLSPCLLVSLSGFVLLAAAPVEDELDWVRQGNAAFERDAYEEALRCYARAEERIADPGLLAFNEGTALYQMGRYHEAELHFRRCREDAEDSRLARLLYNLANCLLRQARPNDVGCLQEAVDLYGRCLEQGPQETDLADDARHNLELARLLWLKARARPDASEGADDDREAPTPRDRSGDDRASRPQNMALPDPSGKPQAVGDRAEDATSGQARADQPSPGRGNLSPLPDEDELVPLTPQDAEEYLKQAATRIQSERREYRQRPLPMPAANVLDW